MLCHFANTFPKFVETFLNSGSTLKRRFREETITDIFMANLMTVGRGQIIVDFPNEVQTGADMEWHFVNQQDGTYFQILIQAKRAYGNGKLWRKHSYKELYHQTRSSLIKQAEILCNTSRQNSSNSFPLYVFYNPSNTCDLARRDNIQSVQGVVLANGFIIERYVKKGGTQNRSIGHLSQYFFPLSDIFCPHNFSQPELFKVVPLKDDLFFLVDQFPFKPPTPTMICKSLNKIIGKQPKLKDSENTLMQVEVANEIPKHILRTIQSRTDKTEEKSKRSIIFLS